MKVPFTYTTPQNSQDIKEIYKTIDNVIKQGIFINGTEIAKFEEEFANYIGIKYCVSTNSGTDALILGVRALDYPTGAEIIVPTSTFFSTALAATTNGHKPVFVDNDENDFGISLIDLERKITKKTKCVIVVHMYGQADKIDDIKRIISKNNYKIDLIEDACQAHGAKYKNQKVGTFGRFSAFSFYPTKNLGAFGDGGAVVTHDKNLADKLRKLRQYGSTKKYFHDTIGFNSRLDTIQAAILRTKLKRLDDVNKKRQSLASYYTYLLRTVYPNVASPKEFTGRKSIFYVYVARVKQRNKLMKHLNENGIDTLIHYPRPLHLQKAFSYLGHKNNDFPISEKLSSEILSLPMHENITKKQIEYVVSKIKEFYG